MKQLFLDLDDRLSSISQITERSGPARAVAILLAHSGDSWFWLSGLFLLWLLGTEYWKYRAVALALGVLLTALIVMSVKFTVRRRRPEGDWGRIYRSTDPHSFPSGHAARAFMLAVLALGLGPLWFGLVLSAWAPLVGVARVSMGVHYPTDIIAGMALGFLMGVLILQFY